MSIVDLDTLSPKALVAQFVIECRGQGTFLQYDDYQIIDEWVGIAPDIDHLLLVLSDILPSYFSSQRSGATKARSLKAARKKVLTKLQESLGRVPGYNGTKE